MKTFREKEVIGWRIFCGLPEYLQDKINKLMEEYNFEDFQFTADNESLYAAILISKKE